MREIWHRPTTMSLGNGIAADWARVTGTTVDLLQVSSSPASLSSSSSSISNPPLGSSDSTACIRWWTRWAVSALTLSILLSSIISRSLHSPLHSLLFSQDALQSSHLVKMENNRGLGILKLRLKIDDGSCRSGRRKSGRRLLFRRYSCRWWCCDDVSRYDIGCSGKGWLGHFLRQPHER